MARHTIGLGALMVILGVGTFGLLGFNLSNWTPLIPAFFGIPFLILGVLAQKSGSSDTNLLYLSVGLALLIFLMMAPALVQLPAVLGGQMVERPLAILLQAIVALLVGAYVVIGIQSFLQARRNQEAAT